MNLDIQEIAHHRNGVSGEPFWVVKFMYSEKPEGEKEQFLATLFADTGMCSVICIDRIKSCGIAFAEGNSWRGDRFEPYLRSAISNHYIDNYTKKD